MRAVVNAPVMPAPVSRPVAVPAGCRVVIVDDHTAILEMMRQIVESISGYKVVGSAISAAEAREICRRAQPDMIVLDLVLPGVSGFGLLGELRAACPRARILIFSGHLRPPLMREAMLSGAFGLIEKTATLGEFQEALRAVGSGQVYFSRFASEVIRKIVNRDPAMLARSVRLTLREKSVLRAIAEGMSSKEISARLGISRHTVVNYRTRLMKKTGCKGVARLARYAVQIGLVDETIEPAR